MAEKQNFEKKDQGIRNKFEDFLKNNTIENHLKLSWSNWGFGLESISESLARLKKYNVNYIELHGNLYGHDLGYNPTELKKMLDDYGIQASGVCGMVWDESELAAKSPFVRQRCIDYFRRQIELCVEVGGEYILFTPGAVGRTQKYDDFEFYRAVETLKILGDLFHKAGIKAAIEPVRSDEVSLVHTFQDAVDMINAVDHPGVTHIAGDTYHMLHAEPHIGETIINYGDYMVNMHIADTNRRALGTAMLDLDIIIKSLYLAGYHDKRAFVTAEPLGQGSDPYYQMYGKTDPEILDELVRQTASYWYEREKEVLKGN